MTGGRVVVLGEAGRNFAAGMSGGIAYVWDRQGNFRVNCNLGTVGLERIESLEEEEEVKEMIARHHKLTESRLAEAVLSDWERFLDQCVKVMPTDFKRVLEQMKESEEAEATTV